MSYGREPQHRIGVICAQGRDITVVDTRSLTMGQSFMVLAAAEAARAGASKQEIVSRAANLRERIHLYAALSTLKYLAMSGRVKSLAVGVANLLDVKPVLTLRDSKLDLLEQVRTRRKAWQRVIELAVKAAGNRLVEQMAILHVNALAEARVHGATAKEPGFSRDRHLNRTHSGSVHPRWDRAGWGSVRLCQGMEARLMYGF